MWSQVDQLAWFLIDAALAAFLVLTAVALAMVMTQQPLRRCALARGALLASLALIPLIGLRWAGPLEFTTPMGVVALPWEWRAEYWFPDRLTVLGQSGPGLSLGFQEWALRYLVVLALATAAWKLAWLVLGVMVSKIEVLRHSRTPSRATQTLYQSIPFPGSSRPALRISSRVARPVLVGPWHPAILIPTELDQPGAAEPLRLSLLHELVHASRRDPWFRMLGDLAQVVWFALPPLWWIRAQMRLDQEFLADQQAAIRFGPFGTYAASLVDLAGPSPRSEPPLDRRKAGLGGPALSLRILMLVRCPFPIEPRAPLWWRLGVPPVLVALTLLASGLTLQRRQPSARPLPAPGVFQPAHGVFRLTRFSLANPTARPYPLPVKLPPQFDLTLEVWAESATSLANLRVIGQPLTAGLVPSPSPRTVEGFSRVRIRRGPDGLRTWVNADEAPPAPNAGPLPDLLTIQARSREPILIRNLMLVW